MSLFDRLNLSFQCPANWEEMEGDDRRRYCGHCRKHVHNLSAMTRAEAEATVKGPEEVCVRMERRRDGTIVVKDCPRATEAGKRMSRIAAAGLAAGGALALPGCADEESVPMMGTPPVPHVEDEDVTQLVGYICPPENSGTVDSD